MEKFNIFSFIAGKRSGEPCVCFVFGVLLAAFLWAVTVHAVIAAEYPQAPDDGLEKAYPDSLVITSDAHPLMMSGNPPKNVVIWDSKTKTSRKIPATCYELAPEGLLADALFRFSDGILPKTSTPWVCKYERVNIFPTFDKALIAEDGPLRYERTMRKQFHIVSDRQAVILVEEHSKKVDVRDSLVLATDGIAIRVSGNLPQAIVVFDPIEKRSDRLPAKCLLIKEPSKHTSPFPELVHQMADISQKYLKTATAIMCQYDSAGRLPIIGNALIKAGGTIDKDDIPIGAVSFVTDRISIVFMGDRKEREQVVEKEKKR